MIQAGLLAALALFVPVIGPAHADWPGSRATLAAATEDLRRAESLYQSLRGAIAQQFQADPREAARGDVIRPPDADIDPRMMVVPPRPRGKMRVIPPPDQLDPNSNIKPK